MGPGRGLAPTLTLTWIDGVETPPQHEHLTSPVSVVCHTGQEGVVTRLTI